MFGAHNGGRRWPLLALAVWLVWLSTGPEPAAAGPSLMQEPFYQVSSHLTPRFSVAGQNAAVSAGAPAVELLIHLKNDRDQPVDQVAIWGPATSVSAEFEFDIGGLGPWTERIVSLPVSLVPVTVTQSVLVNFVVTATVADGSEASHANIVQLEILAADSTSGPPVAGAGSLAESTGDEPAEWAPSATSPAVSLFTASATYHYPLMVPPGVAGLQPALSLSYNSQGANVQRQGKPQSDPVGWGWRLNGAGAITQALEPCQGDANFLCVVDGPETPSANAPALTLAFDGGSFGLIHSQGPDKNGTVGQYFANGNATLYIELCGGSAPSAKCQAADTQDNQPGNGRLEWGSCPASPYNPTAAGCHQSQLFWIVKTAGNRLYRFGYEAQAEQEIVPGRTHAGTIPTLQWRLDEVRDPFGNLMTYQYSETVEERVHTVTSHLAAIEYEGVELNRVEFSYSAQTVYGSPQDGSRPAMSWQTQRLAAVRVWQENALFREYELQHFTTRHGCIQSPADSCQAEMLAGRVSQMSWCAGADFWSGAGLNWKAMMLVDIIERVDSDGDGTADLAMTDRATAGFDYEFRGVDVINGAGWQYRVCRPYLTAVRSPLTPDPIARFYYSWVDQGKANYLSFVTIKRLFPGLGDAPVQRIQYSHTEPAVDSAADNQFQGYRLATEKIYAIDHPADIHIEQLRQTEFLAVPSDRLFELAWHGRRKKETVHLRRGETLRPVHEQIYEYRTQVGAPSNGNYQPYRRHGQLVESRSIEFNPATGERWGAATYYQYDQWANPIRIIFYPHPDGDGSPAQTDVLLYQERTDGSEWLMGLMTSHQSFGSDGRLLSEKRYRYDRQSCNLENHYLTNGLLTAVDQRHNGEGNGECGYGSVGVEEWLTTRYYFGSYQSVYGRPWQQTAVVDPVGQTTFTAYRTTDPWRMAKQFTTADGLLYQTFFGYNDTRYPWKITAKTIANGAQSRYEFDQFGRLTATYGPNGDTGEATVRLRITSYELNQLPAAITTITTPDDPSTAMINRQYFNGLAQPIQMTTLIPTTAASMYSRIDRGYDGQGRQRCTTGAQMATNLDFQGGRQCENVAGHQRQQFDGLGRTVRVTSAQKQSTTTIVGRQKSLVVADRFHLQAAYEDSLGRIVRREEGIAHTTEDFTQLDREVWRLFGNSGSHGVSLTDGLFIRNGGTGQYGFSRAVKQATNGRDVAVTLQFKAEDSVNGWMWTNLERGSWVDGSYRAWGIVTHRVNGALRARLLECTGQACQETTLLAVEANQWYEVTLRAGPGCENAFAAVIWPQDEPQHAVEIERDYCDGDWSANQWNFIFKTQNQAGITYSIDDFAVYELANTHFAYDSASRLTSVTDDLGRTLQTMSYNLLGQKTAMSDAHMGDWLYRYDARGNLVYQRSGRNDALCFDYDDLNRLTRKRYAGRATIVDCQAADHATLAEYRYGASGSALGLPVAGSWAPDLNSNRDEFSYNAAGQLLAHQRTINGRSFTMAYQQFDDLGRPGVIVYPGGEQVEMRYDGFGVDRLTAGGQPLVDRVDHNIQGQTTMISRSNAGNSEFQYGGIGSPDTSFGRLITLNHQLAGTPIELQYQYDGSGNVVGIEEYGRPEQSFGYDSLNRLIEMQEGNVTTRTYRYDAAGNIVHRQVGDDAVTYFYDPVAPHAVTNIERNGVPISDFTYDNTGNMMVREIEGQVHHQLFDVENRLIEVVTGGQSVRYQYDASGRRTMTERDGKTIYYPFPEYEEEVQTSANTPPPATPTAVPPTPTVRVGTGPFLEQNGRVVIEAEHYHERLPGSTGHIWQDSAFAGGINGRVIQAYPNSGRNNRLATNGPEARYRINFSTSGTYTIYIRGLAPNGSKSDDSVLVGLSGQPLPGSYMINQFRSYFSWRGRLSGSDVTVTIGSPGTYTLNLWMREDGLVVDRIMLDLGGISGFNGSTAAGPPESPRGGEWPTPIPTQSPTATPTELPTDAPTNTPPASPTAVPTAPPTVVPTATLTADPTTPPTATPTPVPTEPSATPPIVRTAFPRPTIWPTPPIGWDAPAGAGNR